MNTPHLPMEPDVLTYEQSTQSELRQLSRSQGEIRLILDALKREIVSLSERLANLERARTGAIQGLEGVWTVTAPPEWD